MVSEVVRLHVGKRIVRADCRFVFRNEGPATTVKMGFPDEDSAREGEKGKSVFKSFRSWVDGRSVTTRIEEDDNDGVWQVKQVDLPANKTVVVRDVYSVSPGMGFQGGTWWMSYAAYTLHTGASWKGSIGRADVYVTLLTGLPAPKRLVPKQALDYKEAALDFDKASELRKWNRMLRRHRNTVFWTGPSKPTLKGRTIAFHARNVEPSEGDDIFLAFAPVKDWAKRHGG
jgi:hypothetical protein